MNDIISNEYYFNLRAKRASENFDIISNIEIIQSGVTGSTILFQYLK